MKIKKKIINKNIIQLKFKSQYDVTSTMMRLQEFYESPYENIRGKWFTHETYMDTYAKHNHDTFSYFEDWQGFNIPGNVIAEFFDRFTENGDTKNLSEKEKQIYSIVWDFIKDFKNNGTKFYLIAVYNDDAIDHELAHARFYLDDEYRTSTTKMIKNLPKDLRNEMKIGLTALGYSKGVHIDEIQAYLLTSKLSYLERKFPLSEDSKNALSKIIEDSKELVQNLVS